MKKELKLLIRGVLTVMKSYIAVVALFAVFSVPFLLLNFMTFYSIATFMMMFMIVYSMMGKLAISEEFKDEIGMLGYFKGFVCGLIAMIPYALILILADIILPTSADWHIAPDIRGLVKVILTPHIYFYTGGNAGIWVFLSAYLMPPIAAGLGYIAALKKINISDFIDRKILKKDVRKDNRKK